MQIPVLAFDVMHVVAQTTQPTTQPWWVEPVRSFNPIFLILIPIVLLMFFNARSKKKQDRAQQDRLNAIKRGDLVQTIGGILGKVVEIETGRVRLKVDEGNNSKIWFARTAIHRVVEEEKSAEVK